MITAMFVSSFLTTSENNEDNEQSLGASLDDGTLIYTQIGATTNASVALKAGATPTTVTIPSTIVLDDLNTYNVTSIATNGFNGCTSLTSIDMGAVVAISGNAFLNCTSLQSVTIPGSVTSISNNAFQNCTSLMSVTIPSGVTAIGNNTFRNCAGLTSVTLPDTVLTLGTYSFAGCTSLGHIDLKEVTSVGDNAFNGSGLVSVEMPSVISLGTSAFYSNRSLVSVEIPATVVSIGGSAFNYCTSLTSVNVDPGNLNYCSVDGVLFNIDKTTLILYPTSKDTTSYMIPSSVTNIESRTFHSNVNLISVTIPDSVTSIGSLAFFYCSSMESIIVDDGNLNYCSEDGVLFNKAKTTLITYPAGKGGEYIMPDSVMIISEAAFQGSAVTVVTMPDSVKTLESGAFRSTVLIGINLGSVTSIGSDAFRNTRLISADLSSVTSIGSNAFTGCNDLKIVTLEEGNGAVLTGTGISFVDTVIAYFSGPNVVSMSATMDGTVVTVNIIADAGYGVTNIIVTDDSANVLYDGYSWTFDIATNMEIHVAITCSMGSTITVPPSDGGYFQYMIEGDVGWNDVIDGRIFVPLGKSVDIRGVPDEGYEFSWDQGRHRDWITGDTITFTPSGDVTVFGSFDAKELPDDSDSSVVLFAAIIALAAVLAVCYFVARRP